MRFFTFLLTTSAIAISANATITQKRFVSDFEDCSEDMTTYIEEAISSVSNIKDLSSYDSSDSNPFYRLLGEEITFGAPVDHFYIHAKSCCEKFANDKDLVDDRTILALQSSIANQYNSLVSKIISKKPIVEKDPLYFSRTQYFFEYMSKGLDTFFGCLSPALPAGRTKIDKASSDFKAAYGYMDRILDY